MRKKIALLKPYSIWPINSIFYNYGDIWKEGDGNIFGIGDNTMNYLLNHFLAKEI